MRASDGGHLHQNPSPILLVDAAVPTGAALLPLRAGAGLAVLPQEARFTRTFWMSMPAKGKHLARMQAVWEF